MKDSARKAMFAKSKTIFIKNSKGNVAYKLVKNGDYWQEKNTAVKKVPKNATDVFTLDDNPPTDGHFIGSDANFHHSEYFAKKFGLFDLGSHYEKGNWLVSFTDKPTEFWENKLLFEKEKIRKQ